MNYKNQVMIKSKDSLKPSYQHETTGLEIAHELTLCARCASSNSIELRKAGQPKVVQHKAIKKKTRDPKGRSSRSS